MASGPHATPGPARHPAGVQNPVVSTQTSLPQTIPPSSLPFVLQDPSGNQIIDTTWYLFLYNLARQSLTIGGNPPAITPSILAQVPLPPVIFQESDEQEALTIPGARGVIGPIGLTGYSVALDGLDGDDGMTIPGPPGAAGAAGAPGVGTQGPPGFGLDGADADDLLHIPGQTGSTGATGAQGIPGIGIDGADPDESVSGLRGLDGVVMNLANVVISSGGGTALNVNGYGGDTASDDISILSTEASTNGSGASSKYSIRGVAKASGGYAGSGSFYGMHGVFTTGTSAGVVANAWAVAGSIQSTVAGTTTNTAAFNAFVGNNNAGAALWTNLHGLYVGDPGFYGSTLTTGVNLNIPSGAGRWNLYSPGTAPNFFAAVISATGSPLIKTATQAATAIAGHKTSDGTAATNTLTADTDLTLTFNETGNYLLQGVLFFYEATAGTGGFQFDFNSGTATIGTIIYGVSGFNTANFSQSAVTAKATVTSFATIPTSLSAPAWVEINGYLNVTVAGTLALRWAQASTLGADLTHLMAGSTLMATKIG